jgi:hypothetical protein
MGNVRVFAITATIYPIPRGAEKQPLQRCRTLRQRRLEAKIVTFHHNKSSPASDIIDGVTVIRIRGPYGSDPARTTGMVISEGTNRCAE